MHGSFVLLKKLGWACLPHKRLGLAGPLQGLPVTILIWLPEDQRGSPDYQPCHAGRRLCPACSLEAAGQGSHCPVTTHFSSAPWPHLPPQDIVSPSCSLPWDRGRSGKGKGDKEMVLWVRLVSFSQTCCRCREVGSWEVQKPTAMAQRATRQAGHLNTGLSCIMRQCGRQVLCPWGQQLSRSKPLSLPGDTAQHGTARHGTAQTSMARPGMAQPSPAQPRPAWHDTAWHGPAQTSMA